MKLGPRPRFWLTFVAIFALIVALFVIFEQAGIHLSLDSERARQLGGPSAMAIGCGLLIVDVVLPVPSSVVMIAHGAVFGTVRGGLISIAGSTGAAVFAFLLGRLGQKAFRRFITPEEHDRAAALLERWGLTAIAVTRPIPVLAEAVAIIAGASRFGLARCTVAALLGSAPAAFVYAWAGSHRLSASSDVLIFVLVLGVSLVLWLFGRGAQVTGSR